MSSFRFHAVFDLSERKGFVFVYIRWALILILFLNSTAFGLDFRDAIILERPQARILLLTPDTVRSLEIAAIEAQKQNVPFNIVTRYAVIFDKDTIAVSLAPPYKGGLDGPEFRVEIGRADLRVRKIVNTLEAQ
jgi:hypothetical protein